MLAKEPVWLLITMIERYLAYWFTHNMHLVLPVQTQPHVCQSYESKCGLCKQDSPYNALSGSTWRDFKYIEVGK